MAAIVARRQNASSSRRRGHHPDGEDREQDGAVGDAVPGRSRAELVEAVARGRGRQRRQRVGRRDAVRRAPGRRAPRARTRGSDDDRQRERRRGCVQPRRRASDAECRATTSAAPTTGSTNRADAKTRPRPRAAAVAQRGERRRRRAAAGGCECHRVMASVPGRRGTGRWRTSTTMTPARCDGREPVVARAGRVTRIDGGARPAAARAFERRAVVERAGDRDDERRRCGAHRGAASDGGELVGAVGLDDRELVHERAQPCAAPVPCAERAPPSLVTHLDAAARAREPVDDRRRRLDRDLERRAVVGLRPGCRAARPPCGRATAPRPGGSSARRSARSTASAPGAGRRRPRTRAA